MAHRIRTGLLALIVPAALVALAPSARAGTENLGVALSAQAAQRAEAVSPNVNPEITAPAAVQAYTDQAVQVSATATDADAADILTITATGAPASLSLSHSPSMSPATATLSGTLGAGDAGSFNIEWSVSDGAGGSAATNTALTVDPNRDPTISAPATVLGGENFKTELLIAYSDPDGDTFNSVEAVPLPAGASLNPSPLAQGAQFIWTPAVGQAGTYNVTFTVSFGTPARTASALTVFTINPLDRAPVISGVPGTVNGRARLPITVNATVSDPDGNPITSFVARGTQNTPLPDGAVFTTNGTNTAGTLAWTPTDDQVGTVSIDFIATSGPLNLRHLVVCKIVVNPNRPPVVTAPATQSVAEGAVLSFTVTATDPDGEALTSLTQSGAPLGATFTTNPAKTSGTFAWTPNFNDAGTYNVIFTAANFLSGSATTVITVTDQNRAPVSDANGPYQGVAGVPISFNGTGSSDPDGQPLTYAWTFGDGGNASGPTPMHTYAAGGTFDVALTVTDNGTPPLDATDQSTATVADGFQARVFTAGGYKTIRLGSGKPSWCAHVEPIGGSFDIADVDFASLTLHYAGNSIPAISGKSAVAGDDDKNGISEVEVCFSKDDLRTLFAGLPSGRQTVTVGVEGNLISGGGFIGSVDVDVVGSGGAAAASISPNPLNPSATLSFSTAAVGPVRVRLYDLSGRMVRTLADWSSAAAGYHDITIDGRSDRGEELGSGVYFFRIETSAGVESGRFTILR
jgi:hypothetical protein